MLKERIQKLMVEAMKEGNKERKQALSNVKAALMNKEIECRGKCEFNETAELEAVTKLAKQVRESIEMCPADRTETLAQLKAELAVYEEFLPKQMDENEIRATIEDVFTELGIETPTGKDKGAIMKVLMPKVKGKADGKLVNAVLSTYLK